MYYEVLYYIDESLCEYETNRFRTKKEALDYYNEHKNDQGKYAFWVTKRDKDGFVIEDIAW